jgi:hypothetical protein
MGAADRDVRDRPSRASGAGRRRRAARAAAAGALVVVSAPTTGWGQQPFRRGRALEPTAAVRVFAAAGTLTIEGWDRDSVDVAGTVGAGLTPRAGGTASGYKLSTYDGDPDLSSPSTLVVRVPRRAQVWAKTTTARLVARGLAGDVDLYTIEGAIDVRGASATVTAESMRGDVTVAGAPRWVRAKSGTGRVALDGAAEDVALSTVSGAVTSTGRFARGRFESVSGDVTLVGPLAGPTAADVDTHSGAVTLRLGPAVSAAFTVYTLTGRITNQLSPARADASWPSRRGAGRRA